MSTPAAGTARHAKRHKRRRSWLRPVAVVLVLLVVAGVMWTRVAAHWAGEVVVEWSRGPDCTGTRVVSDPGSGPLIEARPGMRCVLRIEVRNGSGGPVHLEELALPFLAGHPGPVIKADTTSNPELWPATRTDGMDVVRPLDVDLSPDERATFDIPLVFNDRGCNAGTSRNALPDFPTVTVRSLMFSFDRRAATDLAFRQAGPARGCPDEGDR